MNLGDLWGSEDHLIQSMIADTNSTIILRAKVISLGDKAILKKSALDNGRIIY